MHMKVIRVKECTTDIFLLLKLSSKAKGFCQEDDQQGGVFRGSGVGSREVLKRCAAVPWGLRSMTPNIPPR